VFCLSSSCVLCAWFCQCLWLSIIGLFLGLIVHFGLFFNTKNNQEWTTQRHWQNQAHKTQDEDEQNTKTQYNTENNPCVLCAWFCQCLWLSILDCFLCCIVFLCFACLRPVSCVPDFPVSLGCPFLNVFCVVLCFCVLLVFVLCLVCLILPVSYNTENNQEWTTKRHWQNQAHKTQDEDQQNTKTQYDH
jgi:ABC-type Fe3+ transport system permease subunit